MAERVGLGHDCEFGSDVCIESDNRIYFLGAGILAMVVDFGVPALV